MILNSVIRDVSDTVVIPYESVLEMYDDQGALPVIDGSKVVLMVNVITGGGTTRCKIHDCHLLQMW